MIACCGFGLAVALGGLWGSRLRGFMALVQSFGAVTREFDQDCYGDASLRKPHCQKLNPKSTSA